MKYPIQPYSPRSNLACGPCWRDAHRPQVCDPTPSYTSYTSPQGVVGPFVGQKPPRCDGFAYVLHLLHLKTDIYIYIRERRRSPGFFSPQKRDKKRESVCDFYVYWKRGVGRVGPVGPPQTHCTTMDLVLQARPTPSYIPPPTGVGRPQTSTQAPFSEAKISFVGDDNAAKTACFFGRKIPADKKALVFGPALIFSADFFGAFFGMSLVSCSLAE